MNAKALASGVGTSNTRRWVTRRRNEPHTIVGTVKGS